MGSHAQRRMSLRNASIEQIICAGQGNGMFVRMMQLAVGMAIGTDGVEITLLSYLVPCVAADWSLTSLQKGSLTASVFIGELVGAVLLGIISDTYGRRPGFQVATVLVFMFGLLTVFAPSFWWLLFFRSMVGVGAGGMEVPFDLLSEVVPKSAKKRALVDVQLTWALGSLFVGVIAWAVLQFGYSWRWLALFAALPPALVLCCFSFIPESPRWLLANGRKKEATEVLRKIAARNGVDLGDFSLRQHEKSDQKSRHLLDLVRRPDLRRRTLASWVVWAAFGFLYYGIILLSSIVMGDTGTCNFTYSILFFASSSELVGNLLSRWYVETMDRRTSLSMNFAIASFATIAMSLDGAMTALLFVSFIARGSAYVAACFSWIITPELYPTEIRSTGHAVSNSFARLGAIGASYWIASGSSQLGVGILLACVGLTGATVAQALPNIDRHPTETADGATGERRPLLWEQDVAKTGTKKLSNSSSRPLVEI